MPKILIYKYTGKPSLQVKPEILIDMDKSQASLMVMPDHVELLLADMDGFIHVKVGFTAEQLLQVATEMAGAAGISQAMADKKRGAVPSSGSTH
jgi:hypothetical protein